jgi:hypothetical protein
MEKTWNEAIQRVLQESDTPLHYTEITQQILFKGYFKTDGATPAATVNARLAESIKHDGKASPFLRVDKGVFTLNSPKLPQNASQKTMTQVQTTPKGRNVFDAVASEASDSMIGAFGMYWQRELVIWSKEPKLYGKQQANSKRVNFGKQTGIYVLYDHHTVVYVGRAGDGRLGARLYEHTIDRLSSRWNRFSWFGLLKVTDEGDLSEAVLNISQANIVSTFEALLIELLEPPQNRKRGDYFSEAEFLQDVDPQLKKQEFQKLVRSVEEKFLDPM